MFYRRVANALAREMARKGRNNAASEIGPSPVPSPPSSPLPERGNPGVAPNAGVGGPETGPAIGTCVVCSVPITLHWYLVSTRLGERVTGMCCSQECVRSVERR
jgi:hypothetical protein